jgi:hypothetical protein
MRTHRVVVAETVWERTELEGLVLADNELAEVYERIARLVQLRMLDLGHNRLTRLPDSLDNLEGLTDFHYLHDNPWSLLPPTLEKLTSEWGKPRTSGRGKLRRSCSNVPESSRNPLPSGSFREGRRSTEGWVKECREAVLGKYLGRELTP